MKAQRGTWPPFWCVLAILLGVTAGVCVSLIALDVSPIDLTRSLSVIEVLAQLMIVGVAIWTVLKSMELTREQLSAARRQSAVTTERDLLLQLMELMSRFRRTSERYVSDLMWDRVRGKSETDRLTDMSLIELFRDLQSTGGTVLYVVAASRRQRFPDGNVDSSIKTFQRLLQDAVNAWELDHDFITSDLPDLIPYHASAVHKKAVEATNAFLNAAANLIAHLDTPREWACPITRPSPLFMSTAEEERQQLRKEEEEAQ